MQTSATVDSVRTLAAPRPVVRVRLRERLRGRRLDHELAGGAHPATSDELALHATRLISPRTRARIADALEDAVRSAPHPARISAKVPLRRQAVIAASADIESLAAALREEEGCRPDGVALAQLLITDGAGPLYGRGPDEELLAAVRESYRALRLGEAC
jgi:hypothetical protein